MVKDAEACGVTGEHLEQEVKLDVWPGFQLPELVGLPAGAAAAPATTGELVAIYHDTADLRLARAGISLRHRSGDGTGWTLKLPSAVAAAAGAVSRTETTFAGGPQEVPPEVLSRLSAWTRNALLVPVAHLETTRRTIAVTDGEDGRQVAEVVDDEVSALHDGHLALRFRELEVEVEPGAPDGLLDAVVARLVAAGARPGGHRSKVARVLGPRADEPGDLDVPELGGRPSVTDVLRAGIARSVTLIVTHDAGARAGIDPEAVHQARVGTRRLRSDLRTYRTLLLPAWAASLREELGWLAGALGGVRDADVLLERLERRVRGLPDGDAAAGAVLVDRLRAHRAESRRHLLEVLDDQRYLDLLDRLIDAVRHPAVVEAASRPAADVLPGLAARPWRHLKQAVAALGDDPADEQLHEVRIRAKRARYAAEVAALVAGKRARRFAKAVAGVQEVLGDLQDASVSEAWLREAVADVDPAAAAVALRLAAEDRADADRARARWTAAWEPLTGKRLRSWLSR